MIDLHCRLSRDFGPTQVFSVRTAKCFYYVAVGKSDIHVTGPGAEATYTRGDEVPLELTNEAAAACAVLVWEEGT